jgi:hypothetical protein
MIFHSKLTYINFIFKDFEIFLVFLILIFTNSFTFINNSELDFIYAWFIAGVISFLITGTHTFKFIGEPDRYLEYAIFPTFILLVIYLKNDVLWLFIPFIVLYIYNILIHNYKLEYKLKSLYEATNFIKKNYSVNDNKLLGLMNSNPFYQGEILTGLKCMSASEFSTESWGEELLNRYYYPIYPIRTNDFEWMYKEFGVNMILVYKPYLEKIKKSYNHEYNFCKFKEVYNKNNFLVYIKI